MKRCFPIVSLAALVAGGPLAFAQGPSYPTKPVKIIVTVEGGVDLVARLAAHGLGETLGQPFVVEANGAAGGAVAHEAVMRAAPDGHTLMFSPVSTMVIANYLKKNSPFDPVKSYTPIAKAAESVLLITANDNLPFKNVTEMIGYARRNPGKLFYGTTGIGSVHHFSAAEISALTGIDWVQVPYKSGPAVLVDTQSGQTQIGFSILATLNPFLKAGKLRVIGMNGTKRYFGMPDIPTVTEQIPGYQPPPTWTAFFGPAGLPQSIVARLNSEIVRIINTPDVRAKIEASGSVVSPSTPEELGALVKANIATVAQLAKTAGIHPE